ncbi:MAG: ABC transporter ATP-binding protein [Pseudomonadota bacterium]
MDKSAQPVLRLHAVHLCLRGAGATRRLVRGCSLDVMPGETVALVGESGSGKSLTCLAASGLLPDDIRVSEGRVELDGTDLSGLRGRRRTTYLARTVGVVFQDHHGSLNPVRTIGSLLVEAVGLSGLFARGSEREAALAALRDVALPAAEAKFDSYPHQLSGGQRQRVLIALAMIRRPRLLVADEPTTALDTTTQQQVLYLLKRRLAGAALLLVTHDLGVAAQVAGRIAVMYHGRIVECGPVEDIVNAPQHPYTQALLAARPRHLGPKSRPVALPGTAPEATAELSGCAFLPRCSRKLAKCAEPPPFAGDGGHSAACWRAWNDAGA